MCYQASGQATRRQRKKPFTVIATPPQAGEAIYIISIDLGIASSSRKAGLLAMTLVFAVISNPDRESSLCHAGLDPASINPASPLDSRLTFGDLRLRGNDSCRGRSKIAPSVSIAAGISTDIKTAEKSLILDTAEYRH